MSSKPATLLRNLLICGSVASFASAALAGTTALEDLGCGACHVIPGVSWPRSNVGPPLHGYARRNLIAGILPNTSDNLQEFIRDAPRFVPEGAMPPIPMTSQQARDIASYLLSLDDEPLR